MKMRKIIAVMAAVLMLLSILPMAVFAADAETIKYTISNYPAGTQYKAETHELDDYLTVHTNTRCHFTSELRIYAPNGGVNGEVVLASTREMTKVVLNAGNKTSTLTVSTSPDNSTWTQHSTLSVVSSYKDLSVSNLPAGTKYVKLVNGSGQVRIKYITVSYAADAPSACEHVWVDADCDTPKTCSVCGATEGEALGHDWEIISEEEATCTAAGSTTYECAACGEDKVETIPALPHNYVDGVCENCGAEEPNFAEYTITFDANKTQRTEFSTTKQVWKNGPLTFTNNKASSTNAVADYGAPVRLYQNSEIVIECIGMTQIVFDCNSTTYASNLKSSIGAAATVSGDKVTVEVSDNTFTAKLSAQVRIDSMTVTAEVEDAATCEHKNVKECTVYCPDCGELINEGATHVSDAQYPCYAGACIYCGEAIAAVDHVLDADDICTVCGLAPTPEKPVDPENPQLYTFSEFAAGTQYAEGEKHFLDNAVTVITTQSHFTTQLRIYSSTSHNGYAVIKSKKDISAIVLNAGHEADVLNLYVSEDGEVYEAIQVTSSYKDYTVLIPETTRYIKLDVNGENSVRIAKMTLYFDGEVPHTCKFEGAVTKAPTCGEDGVMTYTCTCGEGTYTEAIPATGEHTYADEYDVDCDVCGATREVELEIFISKVGTSASEDVRGVAALFTLKVDGMAVEGKSTAIYDNATVNGYKLISMGAIASNGNSSLDIPAVYLCDDDVNASAKFAIRVINIPDGKEDVKITFTPYFVVEIDGVQTTIYGEAQSASYADKIA